jgi:hypothetical protein
MNLLAIPSSLSRSYSTFPLCSGDNLNLNSCIYTRRFDVSSMHASIWISEQTLFDFHESYCIRLKYGRLLTVKISLHATICRVRFVFWRMNITTDATTPLRLVSELNLFTIKDMEFTAFSSQRNLKCNYFTRAHRLHTPEYESYTTNRGVQTYQLSSMRPPVHWLYWNLFRKFYSTVKSHFTIF